VDHPKSLNVAWGTCVGSRLDGAATIYSRSRFGAISRRCDLNWYNDIWESRLIGTGEHAMTISGKKHKVKGATRATSNSASNGAARKASGKPKLTNAKLRKLAAKHRPPQRWYDEDTNLF
jgi:hypothetical protein